jgi:hypothetical protein
VYLPHALLLFRDNRPSIGAAATVLADAIAHNPNVAANGVEHTKIIGKMQGAHGAITVRCCATQDGTCGTI